VNDELPYMRVFVGDEMSEAAVLDAAERGALWSLKFALWREGGALPADERRLARLAGLDPAAWPGIWAVIRVSFVEADGRITSAQVSAEMEESRKKRQGHREGAAVTNAKRSRKRGAKRGAERADSDAASGSPGASLSGTPSSSSSSSSGSPAAAPAPAPRRRSPAAPAAPAYPPDFEAIWEIYRRKEAKKAAWEAFRRVQPPVDNVLAALSWQCESRSWRDPKYVLQLARYLDKRRWEDAPLPANGFGSAPPDEHHSMGEEPILR
jgi:uncharacterized protein YdaU (DUF1376 family)